MQPILVAAAGPLRATLLPLVLEVPDVGIGAWKHLADVAVVLPAHAVRGRAVLAENLEDLSVSVRLAGVVPADHKLIAGGSRQDIGTR
jgi:hypothetical protein